MKCKTLIERPGVAFVICLIGGGLG